MLWNKSLETGIASIDEQHKELFRQIDILLDVENKARIGQTLCFLEQYIVKHFSDEQRLHASVHYPNATRHKAYHDSYIETFCNLKERFEKEGPTLLFNIEVNKKVLGWLREHILVQDKDFAAYYRSLQQ